MEEQVAYEVTRKGLAYLYLNEGEAEHCPDADTEMVLTYVPEAEEMPFINALRLAHQRDAEAAETLQLDCIQIATI